MEDAYNAEEEVLLVSFSGLEDSEECYAGGTQPISGNSQKSQRRTSMFSLCWTHFFLHFLVLENRFQSLHRNNLKHLNNRCWLVWSKNSKIIHQIFQEKIFLNQTVT